MTGRVITGTYVGTGAPLTVTLGVQPQGLIVFRDKGGTSAAISFKTIDMAGETFFFMSGAVEIITVDGLAITSTGFTVGDRIGINKANEDHFYTVWI